MRRIFIGDKVNNDRNVMICCGRVAAAERRRGKWRGFTSVSEKLNARNGASRNVMAYKPQKVTFYNQRQSSSIMRKRNNNVGSERD